MSEAAPLVALTGATGFVGRAVTEVLAHRGVAMRALARSVPKDGSDIEWVGGSLSDHAALQRLTDGADAVIHIAGLTTSRDLSDFEEANVRGTLNLVEAAVAAGTGRFVFTSSLAAREPRLSAYGASKAKAEDIVRASPLDWTIVRPPAVYGPRDSEMLDLFRAAEWGVVPMPPAGASSLIYVYDLAELLATLAGRLPEATSQTYEPDDGRPGGWSHRELAQAIGWSVGRKPWVPQLSRRWLKRLAAIDGALRGDKAKLTLDRVCYMTHPDWVVSAARAVPGDIWHPRLNTRDGLKATANWYRKEGWL